MFGLLAFWALCCLILVVWVWSSYLLGLGSCVACFWFVVLLGSLVIAVCACLCFLYAYFVCVWIDRFGFDLMFI